MASTPFALPDVGDFDEIEIIEVLVAVGDTVEKEQSVIVLESDKATMEIPSPHAGRIESLAVKVGDRISEGDPIGVIDVADGAGERPAAADGDRGGAAAADDAHERRAAESKPAADDKPAVDEAPGADESAAAGPAADEAPAAPGKTIRPHPGSAGTQAPAAGNTIHASPSIRRYARELGVDLTRVIGSGAKGRIVKEDVRAFVKSSLQQGGGGGGIAVSAIPEVDHSRFGEIEAVPLSRIKKISGAHLHRSWVNVPHVTQFDEADITELETFRKSLAAEAEAEGVRLTPLVFLVKAVVSALGAHPEFNASLDASGENLILKKYFHIGIAVDTPNGLVVPVLRDVDRKGLFELAAELGEVSARARDGKLSPQDMQGGCFSISSLGGIGGTWFTPIVNAPEVAILGVSRARTQPVFVDGEFRPRLILPLALSYDHRVIDGAQAARFTTGLSRIISDIRRVLL